MQSSLLRGQPCLHRAKLSSTPRHGKRQLQVSATFTVRPYTLRTGDTLESIALKRGLQVEELKALNQFVKSDTIKEGVTIMLPAGKLSSRDQEILSGVGPGTYRAYPVRKGESIDDIIAKRGIKREELLKLNPGVNLDKLSENQVLKLPSGKYTVREREMMTGSGLVPPEFFSTGNNFSLVFVAGLVIGAAFSALWVRQSKQSD